VAAAGPSPRAVFDGHNDALTRATADELRTGRPDGHVDLPRMRAGGMAGGIFAVFTPSPGDEDIDFVPRPGGGYDAPPAAPVAQTVAAGHATAIAGRLHTLERSGDVRIVRRAGDLARARADGVPAAVLHLEGAEALDPGLDALDTWHAAGLRSVGPVWSRANAFAHGVPFRHPASPDIGPGLTEAGRALVRSCNELNIVIDLSHLNAAGVRDVAELSTAPLVASHSGAHAIAPSSRNLTDDQLDLIGASGGIVGIVFAVGFLREDGAEETDTPLAAIVAHARHVAERIGVEHVGLGSDFDGAAIPAALGDAAGLPRLLDALAVGGFTAQEVAAIAWDNWARVLDATLPRPA
jgi:membrane dipeptidase